MRASQLSLAACLVLPVGACARSEPVPVHAAPVPVKRDLLIGAWAATNRFQLVQEIEFARDGSMKTVFKAMPEAVPGQYFWTDDRSIVLEYRPSEAARKEFQRVVRTHREKVRETLERKAGPEVAERMAAAYPLELSERQVWHIGLAENQMVLNDDAGLKFSFDPK
jgi:hypothetical protein